MDKEAVTIVRLSVVDSTNSYSTKLLGQSGTKPWTVVVAESQNAGRGQRGRRWESEYGQNLLCSIVLMPTNLLIGQQFFLSAAASVAVCQALNEEGIEAKIKWPNDVLVGQRKIAGLLIENQLGAELVESSVVGIGLNVNQVEFNPYAWQATSVALQTGHRHHDLDEILSRIVQHFQYWFNGDATIKNSVSQQYSERLAFVGQQVELTHDGRRTHGVLKGVSANGELQIERGGSLSSFVNGEIKMVPPSGAAIKF